MFLQLLLVQHERDAKDWGWGVLHKVQYPGNRVTSQTKIWQPIFRLTMAKPAKSNNYPAKPS